MIIWEMIRERHICGERGIRTPGTLSGTTVFKTVAFNHSAISPNCTVEQFFPLLSGTPSAAADGGKAVAFLPVRSAWKEVDNHFRQRRIGAIFSDAFIRVPQMRRSGNGIRG